MLKDSIGHLTDDRAAAGAADRLRLRRVHRGRGRASARPWRWPRAMLAGLGFAPFYAAAICLLANTAPVAFGSIAHSHHDAGRHHRPAARPPERRRGTHLRAGVAVRAGLPDGGDGRLEGLRGVLPAAALCGVAFAGTQFFVSNFMGPAAHRHSGVAGRHGRAGRRDPVLAAARARTAPPATRGRRRSRSPGRPTLLLVVFVLLWGYKPLQRAERVRRPRHWPGLHNIDSAHAAGGRQALALRRGVQLQLALRLRHRLPVRRAFWRRWSPGLAAPVRAACWATPRKQLALAELTLAAVLGLAFLMNYSGATATLGLAFAATGVAVPVLQRAAGLAGRLPHRQRHLGQRAVRQPAGGDRATSWA